MKKTWWTKAKITWTDSDLTEKFNSLKTLERNSWQRIMETMKNMRKIQLLKKLKKETKTLAMTHFGKITLKWPEDLIQTKVKSLDKMIKKHSKTYWTMKLMLIEQLERGSKHHHKLKSIQIWLTKEKLKWESLEVLN